MYRLIYKSRCCTKIDWALVKSILDTSAARNNRESITGVLLATETHFLQVVEGSFDKVNALFLRVARDTRHKELQIISFTCVEHRLFGGWDMHGVGLFKFEETMAKRLKAKYGEEEGGVYFPIDEWRALALIEDIRE